MMERSDLSAELRRWFLSVFLFITSVGGLVAWQLSILNEMEKKAQVQESHIVVSVLMDSSVLAGMFLLALLLWHWPTMIAASSIAPVRPAKQKRHSIFIATLVVPSSVWMWSLVERTNCHYRRAFPTQNDGPQSIVEFWGPPCQPSAFAMLAAWCVLGLLGLLLLRALILLVSHLRKKFGHQK